ncbi:GNAT family N-acetyltransferase [Leisingera aquaemixtae]|uniref:GNAT family N-acetyltransferase n=1 Tax=Leisingera aquaemixtae TaxID=1396826 RepID=UPI0021A55C36|nr:GNAT family N-acetyltransferase [Leisingera aquaemixtae]UWQ45850.1 GNAT family N-acetyltransferase [Leisingera aquaemixtae]
MTSLVTIRPIEQSDRESWDWLWTGYLTFYKATLPARVYDNSFARLLSADAREYRGLIAELNGEAIGIAHYLLHRDMWSVEDTCYLQDLFVDPQARGAGVGRALIGEVAKRAEAEGASVLYWHTQEFNHTARRLYDQVAALTPFVKYDKSLSPN